MKRGVDAAIAKDQFKFVCNICGGSNKATRSKRHREGLLCETCRSNARFRGVAHALQRFVIEDISTPLIDCLENKAIVGIGMSDNDTYADILAKKFQYTNTYYHTDPRLDITDAKSAASYTALDFVISSDVLEHVNAPVTRALKNVYDMLKPGGVFILSVPYLDGFENIEHYPHLYEYHVINTAGAYSLLNLRRDGLLEHHQKPLFHGGPGSVLEMRVFGEGELIAMLKYCGFSEVIDLEPNNLEIGYTWDSFRQDLLWGDRLSKSHILVCRK
jgi:SAM-dependent methyltransferase